MLPPIPMQLVYAGLAGTVIALVVATVTNGMSLRVFFLLALRLAIGWHFLFEGLYKVQSYFTGPTETSKVFTSEPYFTVAEGPFGDFMRRRNLGDPESDIGTYVTPAKKELTNVHFAALSEADQAALCPEKVARLIEAAADKGLADAQAAVPKAQEELEKAKARAKTETDAAKTLADAARPKVETTAAELKSAEDALTVADAEAVLAGRDAQKADAKDDVKKKWNELKDAAAAARQRADDARVAHLSAKNKYDSLDATVAEAAKKVPDAEAKAKAAAQKAAALQNKGQGLKADYAAWLYGASKEDAKAKYITSDVPQGVPERLAHIKQLEKMQKAVADRDAERLGNGAGYDVKRAAAARSDVTAARADLKKDADTLIVNIVTYAGGTPEAVEKPLAFMDKVTMWTLVAAGAGLLLGLFTPVWCVVAAGFLALTYLTHPPFPWYPLPPNTEGNPLFVNKNVIEAIGLLVVAVHPTGRWLGLDSLLMYAAGYRRDVSVRS